MKNKENLNQDIDIGRKSQSGITLIALVVTIIVLLILAGVSIAMLTGENGILTNAKSAKEKTLEVQLKEEIEMIVAGIRVDDLVKENGKGILTEELEVKLNDNEAYVLVRTEDIIQGESKGYEYTIDEDGNVTIGGKITEEKPTGSAVIVVDGIEVEDPSILEELTEAEIKVTGNIKEGTIKEIKAINGAVLNEEKSTEEEKRFTVTENKLYKFLIRASNGRSSIVECPVTSIIEEKKDIFTAIKEADISGVRKIKVNGKTEDGKQTQETYSLNIIRHEGNLILDGNTEKQIEGATMTTAADGKTTYQFGDVTKDVANSNSTYAQNTVVLKVEGNLTINEGITLTSVKNEDNYGGPKGMIIYCTGTLTNNGTISMTKRGAKAKGENVYLWENIDKSYEYVPKEGGIGGESNHYYNASGTNKENAAAMNGNKGEDGTNRATGGGGSGALFARRYNYKFDATSGSGSNGTSYSGGTGGGGLNMNYSGTRKAENGEPDGGAGGNAYSARGDASFGARAAGGGAGNSGGYGKNTQSKQLIGSNDTSKSGENGTGGLLIIYTNEFNNTGSIESCGSLGGSTSHSGGCSGGGSINIFYNKLISEGVLTASGGSIEEGSYIGGDGGDGSITKGSIASGTFIKN